MEITSLGNKNAPVPHCLGTRTERIFCGTTLFAAEAAASSGCQHIRRPVTPATRQKILGTNPFPLPSTAHLPTRFSLRSQLCGTLCGCAEDFTSVSTVSYSRYAYYNPGVSICQALFFISHGHFSQSRKIPEEQRTSPARQIVVCRTTRRPAALTGEYVAQNRLRQYRRDGACSIRRRSRFGTRPDYPEIGEICKFSPCLLPLGCTNCGFAEVRSKPLPYGLV